MQDAKDVSSSQSNTELVRMQRVLKKLSNATEDTPVEESIVDLKHVKKVQCSLSVLETELEALVDLKHVMSDAMGFKVKKSDLLRAGIRLLLVQRQAKIRAEINKIIPSKRRRKAKGQPI